MSRSRFPMRALSLAAGLARWGWRRRPVEHPRRILVLHHLLLGDTLMVTPLLAKLRERHPAARIEMTVRPGLVPLYAGRPYGVVALPFDGRDLRHLRPLLHGARVDLALLPADNRWSWLARGLGARWIVGFAADRPAHKNWPVDELRPYAAAEEAFGDTAATLVDGPAPAPFDARDWPLPSPARAPALPPSPYAVLHVGASSALKWWPAERWRSLARELQGGGYHVAFSAGPGEGALLDAIAPPPGQSRYAGTLALDALAELVRRAALLVCPDTGVAHLGRVTGVPTVTLYGPGAALLNGPGLFWAGQPGRAVTVDPFPCRDQQVQFFRSVAWLRRCERAFGPGEGQCARALCMEAIDTGAVNAAVAALERPASRVRSA